MNTSKITERALALCIQQYAQLVAGTSIRPFQCLSEDSFRTQDFAGGTRSYPLIEIRSGMPAIDASLHTEHVTCSVTIATHEGDDQDHSKLSDLVTSVDTVIKSLFDQAKTQTDGDELTLFKSVYSDEFGSNFYFGGITIEGGQPPFDDEGIAVITQSVIVHYSRK